MQNAREDRDLSEHRLGNKSLNGARDRQGLTVTTQHIMHALVCSFLFFLFFSQVEKGNHTRRGSYKASRL